MFQKLLYPILIIIASSLTVIGGYYVINSRAGQSDAAVDVINTPYKVENYNVEQASRTIAPTSTIPTSVTPVSVSPTREIKITPPQDTASSYPYTFSLRDLLNDKTFKFNGFTSFKVKILANSTTGDSVTIVDSDGREIMIVRLLNESGPVTVDILGSATTTLGELIIVKETTSGKVFYTNLDVSQQACGYQGDIIEPPCVDPIIYDKGKQFMGSFECLADFDLCSDLLDDLRINKAQ